MKKKTERKGRTEEEKKNGAYLHIFFFSFFKEFIKKKMFNEERLKWFHYTVSLVSHLSIPFFFILHDIES